MLKFQQSCACLLRQASTVAVTMAIAYWSLGFAKAGRHQVTMFWFVKIYMCVTFATYHNFNNSQTCSKYYFETNMRWKDDRGAEAILKSCDCKATALLAGVRCFCNFCAFHSVSGYPVHIFLSFRMEFVQINRPAPPFVVICPLLLY